MNVGRTRTENWNGYNIRFVEIDGEWWAVLNDICDALNLKAFLISQRLDPSMMTRLPIEAQRENKTRWILAVNELGIYETLFASRKLEARKFRYWTAGLLQEFRKIVRLEGYEIMRMTDSKIQKDIDNI